MIGNVIRGRVFVEVVSSRIINGEPVEMTIKLPDGRYRTFDLRRNDMPKPPMEVNMDLRTPQVDPWGLFTEMVGYRV